MNVIANRIKDRRKQLGLSQVDLARLVNISQTQISKYELGQNLPTADILVALSRVLRISIDWLVGVSDEIGELPHDDLSEAERQLLALYRSKSGEQQQKLLEIARLL